MSIRVHIHTGLYVYWHVFTTDVVTWIFFIIILELFFLLIMCILLKEKFIKYLLLNFTPLFPIQPCKCTPPRPKWWTSCFQSHGRGVFFCVLELYPRLIELHPCGQTTDSNWSLIGSGSTPTLPDAIGTAAIFTSAYVSPLVTVSGACREDSRSIVMSVSARNHFLYTDTDSSHPLHPLPTPNPLPYPVRPQNQSSFLCAFCLGLGIGEEYT